MGDARVVDALGDGSLVARVVCKWLLVDVFDLVVAFMDDLVLGGSMLLS